MPISKPDSLGLRGEAVDFENLVQRALTGEATEAEWNAVAQGARDHYQLTGLYDTCASCEAYPSAYKDVRASRALTVMSWHTRSLLRRWKPLHTANEESTLFKTSLGFISGASSRAHRKWPSATHHISNIFQGVYSRVSHSLKSRKISLKLFLDWSRLSINSLKMKPVSQNTSQRGGCIFSAVQGDFSRERFFR